MKVLLVLDRWLPRKGGLERYAAALARYLAQHGDPVRVVTLEVGEATAGVEFTVVPAPRWPRLRRERAFYAAADAACAQEPDAARVALRHPGTEVDVYVPMGGTYQAALRARQLRRRARWPWVRAKEQLFLQRERTCLERRPPPIVLAPSELVARQVVSLAPGRSPTTVVTGLAVDCARFAPAAPAERQALRRELLPQIDAAATWLLFVGHDAWRKGLDRARAVLAAVRASVDPHAVLLCAGRALRRSDPARGVVALGEVDPAPFDRAADVLLALSREDSFGLHVAEALASGLPVLTTPETGACQLLTGPEHGTVAPGDQPASAWAAEIARLRGCDPVAVASRRAAVHHLDPSEHFPRVRALLVGACQARPDPAKM